MNLHPVKLGAAFKDYLWGGTKLKTAYNKKSDLEKVAESWELSTHKDGPSTILTGPFAGMTLPEYLEKNGRKCLGSKAMAFDYFPILIKLIDAKDSLSVQVHPNDAYALAHEGEYGKTEMWYILDCEEGASLYYGLNTTISREEFAQRIKDNTLLEVLNQVKVKKGDVFFIEAGTIHAIGKGIVICEIQQNSNTTYRVYDYDRRDKDGNPRALHIDQAIAVSNLSPAPAQVLPESTDSCDLLLASCKYFTVRKLTINKEKESLMNGSCFHSLVVTDGTGTLCMNGEELFFTKGDSIFIPAQNNAYTLSGSCEIILSYV